MGRGPLRPFPAGTEAGRQRRWPTPATTARVRLHYCATVGIVSAGEQHRHLAPARVATLRQIIGAGAATVAGAGARHPMRVATKGLSGAFSPWCAQIQPACLLAAHLLVLRYAMAEGGRAAPSGAAIGGRVPGIHTGQHEQRGPRRWQGLVLPQAPGAFHSDARKQ